MDARKILKYFALIGIALTISTVCNGQKKSKNNNNTMNESYIVIHETKNEVQYLCNVSRYDDLEYGIKPESVGESFYLMFDINSHSKLDTKISSSRRYMMHVNKLDNDCKMQLRLESDSFYENGKNVGHAEPTGKWYVDDELSKLVFNYYLSHQETIPVHTENIDISQWKPLFTLYKNPGNQAHVMKLTVNKLYPKTRHFELGCELLGFSNVLINGKLTSYSISTHTLLFYQGHNQYFPENMEYYVQLKHNSTKTYTNAGKDMTELTVPDRVEEYRPVREIDFAQKVLNYYLEHKSEMETNMENK